jgi:hypothetical protein
VFCVGLNKPLYSPLQTEVVLGSLIQALSQGHIHSLIRIMSISPSHDLIFIPINLICRPDYIIQKVTTLLNTQKGQAVFYQVRRSLKHVHVTKRPLNRRCHKGDQVFPRRVIYDPDLKNKRQPNAKYTDIRARSQGKCSLHDAQRTISTRNREFRHPYRKSQAPRHRRFVETKKAISDLFCESGPLRPIL